MEVRKLIEEKIAKGMGVAKVMETVLNKGGNTDCEFNIIRIVLTLINPYNFENDEIVLLLKVKTVGAHSTTGNAPGTVVYVAFPEEAPKARLYDFTGKPQKEVIDFMTSACEAFTGEGYEIEVTALGE